MRKDCGCPAPDGQCPRTLPTIRDESPVSPATLGAGIRTALDFATSGAASRSTRAVSTWSGQELRGAIRRIAGCEIAFDRSAHLASGTGDPTAHRPPGASGRIGSGAAGVFGTVALTRRDRRALYPGLDCRSPENRPFTAPSWPNSPFIRIAKAHTAHRSGGGNAVNRSRPRVGVRKTASSNVSNKRSDH